MTSGPVLLAPPNASSEDPAIIDLFSFMATEDAPPYIGHHIVIRARHSSVFKNEYVQFVRIVRKHNGFLSRRAIELFHMFAREQSN